MALESRIELKESGIPQKFEIHDPIFTYKDWKQVPGIRHPTVEFRVQDYLGSFTSGETCQQYWRQPCLLCILILRSPTVA